MTRHSYFEDYFFLKSFIARAVTNRLSSFHRTSLSVGLLSFRSGLWTTMGQGNVSRLKDIVGDEHFCHYVIFIIHHFIICVILSFYHSSFCLYIILSEFHGLRTLSETNIFVIKSFYQSSCLTFAISKNREARWRKIV